MAFAATLSTSEARLVSIGPVKIEIFSFSAASGDTSGTITSKSMHNVMHVLIDGKILHTSAPVCSGNTTVLAFADPVATIYGTAILIGV